MVFSATIINLIPFPLVLGQGKTGKTKIKRRKAERKTRGKSIEGKGKTGSQEKT